MVNVTLTSHFTGFQPTCSMPSPGQLSRAPRKKGNVQPKQYRAPVAKNGLDAMAKSYAKLLADPCYGRLTMPLYNSAGTGQLVRVETDFILGAEATSVGAAVIFTPGIVNASTGSCGVIIPTTVVASDSATITWSSSFSRTPGYGMAGLFGSVRVVSACLQAQYVGPEQTRAGIFSMGQMSRGAAVQFTTLSDIRSSGERVLRTPDGTAEIRLAPTGDSDSFNAVDGAGAGLPNEKMLPSLVFCASGIPSSTGIRIRLVQVLEWTPKPGSGADATTISNSSGNSLTHVLTALEKANPNWRYDLLTGMAAYAPRAAAMLSL